jgi:hypothetical protein
MKKMPNDEEARCKCKNQQEQDSDIRRSRHERIIHERIIHERIIVGCADPAGYSHREATEKAGRGVRGADSVGTEPDMGVRIAAQRVLHELSMAVGAQIVRATLIATFLRLDVVNAFEDVLDLGQIVPIILCFVSQQRLQSRVDFQFHDVPHFLFGVDRLAASVTGIMNHECGPDNGRWPGTGGVVRRPSITNPNAYSEKEARGICRLGSRPS